jgi:hypothetical protein|tara:strand:- start:603 stop:1034 length:432 start_codon:yes stop_codon:yes gene_type:complete
MATFTITGIGSSGYAGDLPNAKVYRQVVDFTKFTVASGDIVQVFSLPAGTMVLGAGYEILTAGSGSGTLALGDQSDVDRFVDEVAQTGAGQKTPLVAAMPHFYASADTIDLTVASDTVNSKVNVWCIIADCNNVEDDQKVTIS